jgi:hypothetical protein
MYVRVTEVLEFKAIARRVAHARVGAQQCGSISREGASGRVEARSRGAK